MILVDSSAWIEYLRHTGSATDRGIRDLIDAEADVAVTDVVSLELLSGVSEEERAGSLHQFLLHFTHLTTHAPGDYEVAAAINRVCRRAGRTPRSRFDCLIAAVALRTDVEVLHRDRDFDLIARHTPLRVREA